MRILAGAVCTAIVLSTGCASSESGEEPLTVGAASSLRTALAEYEGPGGREFPPVRTSFAGSDLIAAQIRQGAGIDVIAAASTSDPDGLFKDGLADQPVPYARNRIVIAVPNDSDITTIEDLASPGTSVVIGDEAVPVGTYTREILAELPVRTGEAITANVRSEEPDVSSIVAKLVQEAADAGFVYATDVLGAPDSIRAIPIPANLQPKIVYSAAVVSDSPIPDAGSEYIEGLLTGNGAEQLRAAGFLPPP